MHLFGVMLVKLLSLFISKRVQIFFFQLIQRWIQRPICLMRHIITLAVILCARVQTNQVSPKQIPEVVYVTVESGAPPDVPRKRIRGMYPPSGLRESSFGSSSSCSHEKCIHQTLATCKMWLQLQESTRKQSKTVMIQLFPRHW